MLFALTFLPELTLAAARFVCDSRPACSFQNLQKKFTVSRGPKGFATCLSYFFRFWPFPSWFNSWGTTSIRFAWHYIYWQFWKRNF